MKEWRWRRDEGTRDRVRWLWARKKNISLTPFFLLLLRDCMKLCHFFCLFVFALWNANELHQYSFDILNLRWSHPHQSKRRRNSQSCNLDHRSLSWRGWSAKAYFADHLEELLVHPGVYWKPYWPVQLPLGRTHRLLALHQLSPLHLAPYVCLSAPKRTLFNPRAWCMMGGNWFRAGGGVGTCRVVKEVLKCP